MSLSDFIKELQTQDSIVYSQPPESAIHIIPPEKVYTKIIPPESPTPKNVIKLKISQQAVTTAIKKDEDHIEVKVDKPAPQMIPQSNIIDLGSNNNSIIKKPPPKEQPKARPVAQPPAPPIQQVVQKPVQPVQQPTKSVELSKPEPVAQTPTPPPIQENTDEQIFLKSGTESSKYQIWLEYFNKAKSSKKSNPIVDRMKIGRFTITPDNKVLLLPDYDIVGKDPDDVLKDKWF